MSGRVALEICGLSVSRAGGTPVLEGVDLALRAGEVTAIVGETGCGKSTLLNSILGLLPEGLRVGGGRVLIGEPPATDLLTLGPRDLRRHLGTRIGYVPQDARAGLNPLMTARAHVREAWRHGEARSRGGVDDAMLRAGLPEDFVASDADRRPARLSGGQCQRVLIAQAIVNRPGVLLMDEPTASLDPLARRKVQETIGHLAEGGCAVCLVTHDIEALLGGLADRIGVMYLGRIVELGPAEAVLSRPKHPYTAGLLGCVPRLDGPPTIGPIPGEMAAHAAEVAGCKFHPRCGERVEACRSTEPTLTPIGPGREVACHVAAG